MLGSVNSVLAGGFVPFIIGQTQSRHNPLPSLYSPRMKPLALQASMICLHGSPLLGACAKLNEDSISPMTKANFEII